MAKAKKDESSTEIGDIDDALKELDKLNPDAAYLDENALSNVNEWIDTGAMALNAIISGSLYGGIPMGRITGFFGPESCGKTLIVNKIMANAQKKGMRVIYFDTEGALDADTAKRLGCDISKIKHCPIEIIEDCRNQIIKVLGLIVEKNLHGKAIIAIDSLGNLISRQEKNKIEEGSDSPDMGNRAKSLKSMMRAITHAAARSKCPVVFTNHIYEDPSQLHPSKIKKQAGGSGPMYMSSVLVQMAKRTEKTNDSKNKDSNEENVLNADINGLTLRAFITKNRFIPPFLETELYLNFKTGLNKLSGLLEMCEKYNILSKQGHRYDIDGELMFFKDIKNDLEIWQDHILPKLEKTLIENLRFNQEV
jgi:RecA/RadA recombinase